ncbi:MAG: glutamate racemase, partial [Cyanobacteria bacterium]|nr:glutamate racemase [Cyanobacteriota bacterium]
MFDSGLGGLTVLRRLLALRPGQPCIYLADTARVPYGGRSAAEIRGIAAESTSYLKKQGSQALLMACNTSNALA